MTNFAPVLISVYNRPGHFMRCIESLSQNSFASETPLFVAIDAPSRDADIKPNETIRSYAASISGFKSVFLFLRNRNLGARANMDEARRELFEEYPSLIMSEDDNVFSPFFLTFINQGLSLYEHEKRIFAICGYNYPMPIPKGYKRDSYLAMAFSAWGFGIWRDRFFEVDWDTSNFWSIFRNPFYLRKFNKALGDHVFIHLLQAKMRNQIYGDTAICYHLFNNHSFCIFPKVSLVRNTGHDGTGLHCRAKNPEVFHEQLIWETPPFPQAFLKDLSQDMDFSKAILKYFKTPLWKKAINYCVYLVTSVRKQIQKYAFFKKSRC